MAKYLQGPQKELLLPFFSHAWVHKVQDTPKSICMVVTSFQASVSWISLTQAIRMLGLSNSANSRKDQGNSW